MTRDFCGGAANLNRPFLTGFVSERVRPYPAGVGSSSGTGRSCGLDLKPISPRSFNNGQVTGLARLCSERLILGTKDAYRAAGS